MSIFLHKARRTYYHRAHVPKKLRHLLEGRSEVWRSLDTANKDEAKLRSATWESRFLHLYKDLRKRGESMTKDEREDLIARWLDGDLIGQRTFAPHQSPILQGNHASTP